MKDPLLSTRLAELHPNALLDQVALAQALDVSPRTLRRMVARFELPPGMTLGGKKTWLAGNVLQYLTERANDLAGEAKRMSKKIQKLL